MSNAPERLFYNADFSEKVVTKPIHPMRASIPHVEYIGADIAAAEVLRLRETEAALGRDLSDALDRASANLERAVAAEDEARALRAEVARLLPWAKLGHAVMEGWPDYGDLDGFQLQDLAEKSGVLVQVEGGYNPEVHGDADHYGAEPGDDWFTMIPTPAALGEEEASHDR